MEPAIEIKGLDKTYRGGVKALRDVNLTVDKGSCFGLLGPNGAGKSTLVKALLGIVRPTSGEAMLNGKSIRETRARVGVGYLPEGHHFPRYLTGRGVCAYFGRLAGLRGPELEREIDAKLSIVGMDEWADTRISKYSKGMNQRIGLAQALLGDPSIVFLDEPTDGVDPVGRKEIRDAIRGFADSGATIFLNSHILAEVEKMCDQIAVLHRGQVIEQGNVDSIKARVGGDQTKTPVAFRTGTVPDTLWADLKRDGATSLDANRFEIQLDDQGVTPIVDRLRSANVEIYAIEPQGRDLEAAFIDLIDDQGEGGVGGAK